MSKTHAVLQTPAGEYIINSIAESGLPEAGFYELRSGNTIEYSDGIYTFMFSGTYDQCALQIKRFQTYTPVKPPSQPTIFSTPIVHQKPFSTIPRTAPQTNPFSSSFKRKIFEEEEEEQHASQFKRSRIIEIDEDEYQTLKSTVGDLSQKIGFLEDGMDRLKNEMNGFKDENTELRAELAKLKTPPRPRANRTTEDELSRMKIIDENDNEVLLSSLNERRLKLLLEQKQQTLDAIPSYPGLNHQDIINKIGEEMFFELAKRSTMGFGFRLATYFINQEAFLKTYFKPLVPHSGNNRPSESKRTISDAAYKLIKYYTNFFAGCLFQYSPSNHRNWMVSVIHSLNRKVDYLNDNVRKSKPVIYYNYDNHNPLFTPENCFEEI